MAEVVFEHAHEYLFVGLLLVGDSLLEKVLFTSYISRLLHLALHPQALLVRSPLDELLADDVHPS